MNELAIDLPQLDPGTVADESQLADIVEAWALTDVLDSANDIACFEAALQDSLDAASWGLASRLLGLMRAAADDRILRAVRWAFLEGLRHALLKEEP